MIIKNSYVSEIKRLLNIHEIQLDSDLLNDSKFFLKMKYELMRYDVKDSFEQYFAHEFMERVKIFKSRSYIVIPKVILILSNKCSLACKNCSMLMPKFKIPWELEADEAVRCIDNFLRGTDEILNFNVIGGEPFLYRDLPLIIKLNFPSKYF